MLIPKCCGLLRLCLVSVVVTELTIAVYLDNLHLTLNNYWAKAYMMIGFIEVRSILMTDEVKLFFCIKISTILQTSCSQKKENIDSIIHVHKSSLHTEIYSSCLDVATCEYKSIEVVLTNLSWNEEQLNYIQLVLINNVLKLKSRTLLF